MTDFWNDDNSEEEEVNKDQNKASNPFYVKKETGKSYNYNQSESSEEEKE